MRTQLAPDVFAFAQGLRHVVDNHDAVVQAFGFWLGQRRFGLSLKTMAGIAHRDISYVCETMKLMDTRPAADQMSLREFFSIIFSEYDSTLST